MKPNESTGMWLVIFICLFLIFISAAFAYSKGEISGYDACKKGKTIGYYNSDYYQDSDAKSIINKSIVESLIKGIDKKYGGTNYGESKIV